MGARPIGDALCACTAVLAAVVALAAVPTADAARRAHATFTVTAAGTQTVSATLSGESEGCADGAAREELQFASRPLRVRIEDTGPFLEMVGLSPKGEDSRQEFTAAGIATRAESGAFVCHLSPAMPDCGTRSFSGLDMVLLGVSLSRGRITLSVSLAEEEAPALFSTCPLQHAYPAVFAGEVPHLRLTGSTLFDRHRRTIVLSANRLTSAEVDGSASHTAMTLKLTLRRL